MRYVIRLWLITVLLSPLLWAAGQLLFGIIHLQGLQSGIEGLLRFLYLGGLLVGLPVFCVFYLFYSIITQQEKPVRYKRILLSLISVVLVVITFIIVDMSIFTRMDLTSLLWLLSYTGSFVGSIWIFKLPPPTPVI